MSGGVSYRAGSSAEDAVGRAYHAGGYVIRATRFRGTAGEIDLIAERDGRVVFIEVKKSRSHASAAERLQPRQIERLITTASEYLDRMPHGQNTESRFDVALVDATGQIEIIENALTA